MVERRFVSLDVVGSIPTHSTTLSYPPLETASDAGQGFRTAFSADTAESFARFTPELFAATICARDVCNRQTQSR